MKKILFVIVIYNKSISDLYLDQDDRYKNQEIDVFIYDNSKLSQEIPIFENINIYYEHDENNSGVSRAYNQAYKKAKQLNKELLLVLDQDSYFEINFIEKYMKTYQTYKNNFIYAPIVSDEKKLKIYSPFFMNNFVGKTQLFENFTYEETYDLVGQSVINSGLMIPLELFGKIGGYNEKLKLDFSDIYFIEKYKELNSKIILVDLYLKHSISGDEGKDLTKEHNRFRYYCNGARELSRSLKVSTTITVIRRMLVLMLKYKTIFPIYIFFSYYVRGEEI